MLKSGENIFLVRYEREGICQKLIMIGKRF
ncbi:hypothetical protein HMPREF2085_01295 [Fusobacterium nucleatum 13_3C]|uniref:Uncharacterized protein n=1 Tax=Fusobacterium nucleatum 13_3C TaxID=1357398 RepID=X7RZA3_FUSNU|nr:hypothetical protein HMPREF2085_01295 [Fusobacterium nucleatum 13_3C]